MTFTKTISDHFGTRLRSPHLQLCPGPPARACPGGVGVACFVVDAECALLPRRASVLWSSSTRTAGRKLEPQHRSQRDLAERLCEKVARISTNRSALAWPKNVKLQQIGRHLPTSCEEFRRLRSTGPKSQILPFSPHEVGKCRPKC